MTIVGTRPEIIRLSSTIKLLDQVCDHTLVHTQQNHARSLNEGIFEDLKLRKPDHAFKINEPNPMKRLGESFRFMEQLLEDHPWPDAVLVLGDTNSTLVAYIAKQRGIPVFHCEAGNRCWDDRVPEEVNRRLVDHLADVNLPYGELQRTNLLREGIHPSKIWKTGSPMAEVIIAHEPPFEESSGPPHVCVSIHRAENTKFTEWIGELLTALHDKFPSAQIIFPVHPRLDDYAHSRKLLPWIDFIEPVSPTKWWSYQRSAEIVLSDSGTLLEEAYILDFPCINLRNSNERPEGMEGLVTVTAGTDPLKIIENIQNTRAVGWIPEYENNKFSQSVWNCIRSNLT